MAVTKTKFINYIRCPRYVALDEIKTNELDADVSFKEYQEAEYQNNIQEILNTMSNEEGESLIDVKDEQLEVMLPYYKKIEELAIAQVKKQFDGNPIPNDKSKEQESFDFTEKGIKYLCYVDIYNHTKEAFDIIEVKATTSRKFLKLGPTIKGELYSIFMKDVDGIYRLKEEIKDYKIENEMPMTKYLSFKQKLFDKYHACGHYVYDLLVQRMIIEGYLKENKQVDKCDLIHYYLAVLNSEYVFNGEYDEAGEPIYKTDEMDNEIIVLFDFTQLTKDLMDKVILDKERVHHYLNEMNVEQCDLGIHCEHKKNTKCKFLDVCFYNVVPKKNSILNYIDNHFDFKDEMGNKYQTFELINKGTVKMIDLPESYLTRNNNIVQRKVIIEDKPYIDKNKIKDGLNQLKYPLYHLDFETFPCPLPRYKGEKCYMQSVFQFSLHIEKAPGECDYVKDHYEFLAPNHNDCREEIAKKLCEYIDPSQGLIITYNQSFEKGRLLELSVLFPQYQEKLKQMSNITYDLLYLVKNNTKLYERLGYNEEVAKTFNYYHPNMNGSFSIKKVLPALVPELNYDDLDVSNGTDALVTYAKFIEYSKKEYEIKYQALLKYCAQDTWAMVKILEKLRTIVK